jgi:adaptin ear-binding coat-associated protein 1/2
MASGCVDPATGEPLPADAIQRVLFITRTVHVYSIPPLTSVKGYTAADWTTPDPRTGQSRQIFTARMRIVETAISIDDQQEQRERVKIDILLEDQDSGSLFAAAPYTEAEAVEHVLDSSRFFALRVVGDGRKAVLGIGFEGRSEAFDFGVALQESKKILALEEQSHSNITGSLASEQRKQKGPPGPQLEASAVEGYSLRPGQTISTNAGRSCPIDTDDMNEPSPTTEEYQKALFSIPPPPPPASIASMGAGEQTGRRRRRVPSIIPSD